MSDQPDEDEVGRSHTRWLAERLREQRARKAGPLARALGAQVDEREQGEGTEPEPTPPPQGAA
jgi:hypothetical protein